MTWEDEFRRRLNRFETTLPPQEDTTSISIKIRVSSGCFHREHSPHAYRIIDEYLHSHPSKDLAFEEHESGPEILVWLSLVIAGVSLTANVINLVTAIIKARTEGIKHGDRPSEPLELILRGFDEDGKMKEEKILRINSLHDVSEDLIEKTLLNSANKMIPKKNIGKKKATSNTSTK
ncbi:MAG: hypothetical protein MUO64_18985 [Anaerolineales bacterium]|nr:hypothetical protein [Anaerolineales bacterium]